MPAPTVRTIAWEIPSMHGDDHRPGAESIDFAAWLGRQEPKEGNDSTRLSNAACFVWHVSSMLSPSKHLHKGAAQHRIQSAYKDSRIFQEFQRWVNALDWSDKRHIYTRDLHHLNSPLARPWLIQCMKENATCRIGFQLASALHCDDKLEAHHKDIADKDLRKNAEETVRVLKQLGTTIEENTMPTTTLLSVLSQITMELPHVALLPQQHLFQALYDPAQASKHDLNSRQGQMYFRDGLFKHLMSHCRSLDKHVQVEQPLALPHNWMDTP